MVKIVEIILQHYRKNKLLLFGMMSGLFFSLSSYAQNITQPIFLSKNAVTEVTLKQYSILPYNFIDLIKAIPKPLPEPLYKFQKIFNRQLYVKEKDDDSISYILGSYRTLDGVVLKDVGVLISLKAKWQVIGFSFDLDPNQCISSQVLKKEFGFLIPELLTFHPMPNAPIAFHTTDEWGIFVMGITTDHPDCATNIGIGMFANNKKKQEWIEYVHKQVASLRERK